jgi:hypothetical protein
MPAWLRRRVSAMRTTRRRRSRKPYTAELEGQASQAAAQGSRRALDRQIHQDQTARGWLNAASRSGNPAIWLSEPCLDLSTFQPQTQLPTRAVVCAKACSTAAIRRAGLWDRSAANELLNKNGFVSHVHRYKSKGRAMHETMRRANNAKSKIRSRVEHVFVEQKDRMGLFIRTIGIARATTKIGMANLVYNTSKDAKRGFVDLATGLGSLFCLAQLQSIVPL